MKGLLIKDFRLLISQKMYYMMVVMIALALLTTSSSPTFMVGYLSILCMMFVVSSISYDEFDNGYAFLFCLPITRKSYVREKYVFSILMGAGAWVVTAAITVAVKLVLRRDWAVTDLLVTSALTVLAFQPAVFVMIPIQLKFGSEKGRMAQVVVYCGVFALLFLGLKFLKELNIDVAEMINQLVALNVWICIAAAFLAVGLILFLSMKISEKILQKKEF